MKIITAKTGEQILVDDEDFASLSQYTWHLNDGYACRITTVQGKTVRYRMHREVLGLRRGTEDLRLVDHINLNKLDNQKSNLRIATHAMNSANRSAYNKSGFKGVRFISGGKRRKRWLAEIKHEKKLITIGYFESAEEAYDAYCQKAVELRGFV